MSSPPRPTISIITPSFNQGEFIRANIESVLQQDFHDYEHVVIDGGSTDDTLQVLSEYPHLRTVSEEDKGHADALNKGFAMARGRILSFLNADDTLYPGALRHVAEYFEGHPESQVLMGRCRFIDEDGEYTGIEHPSYYLGHRRMLAIWKGHGIPQPSVFWRRQVWESCGPMDVQLPYAWIDYDFFCRVAKRYRFATIDKILSSYRLHASSKTNAVDEAMRLEESIAISRRYWGPWWSFSRWQLQLSYWLFRLNRKGRAVQVLKHARSLWNHGRRFRALALAATGGLLAPEVAYRTVFYPPFRNRVLDRIATSMRSRGASPERPPDPQTIAMLEHKSVWGDNWVGPILHHELALHGDTHTLRIEGWTDVLTLGGPLELTYRIDDSQEQRLIVEETGPFHVSLLVDPTAHGENVTLHVVADKYFVPDRSQLSGDFRPLSWKLESIQQESESGQLLEPSGDEL